MFSKYKKPASPKPVGGAEGVTELKPVPSEGEAAPAAPVDAAKSLRKKPDQLPIPAATAAAQDKEAKRRQRLDEIKTEMHHRLLENLNLSALEGAKESELKAEITAITSDELGEMGIVLNREDRQTLQSELFDEVTGLGPLETLLKDDSVNDILVNGPNRVFIERAGRLELSDIRFK
ncbi:MAG: CpaF family protein, partial [Pseudomonadota bacterium]